VEGRSSLQEGHPRRGSRRMELREKSTQRRRKARVRKQNLRKTECNAECQGSHGEKTIQPGGGGGPLQASRYISRSRTNEVNWLLEQGEETVMKRGAAKTRKLQRGSLSISLKDFFPWGLTQLRSFREGGGICMSYLP